MKTTTKTEYIFFGYALWTSLRIRIIRSLVRRILMKRRQMRRGLIRRSVIPRTKRIDVIIINSLLHKRMNMFLSKKHFI